MKIFNFLKMKVIIMYKILDGNSKVTEDDFLLFEYLLS